MKSQEQGGLPSPGETKGKTLHTPSPALAKANGNLAEELSQKTLKRLQNGTAWPEGCHNQWEDSLDPGSEVEGCAYTRKRHFPWKTGTNACCRLGSSALDSKPSAETLLCWICGATENHWRRKKFTLNMVQSKEHAKSSWSVLENMRSENPPHMLPSPPAKSRWNYHSAGVVLYKCKGADGCHQHPSQCWYRDTCPANPAFPTPQLQSSPRAKATTLLTHLLAPLLTVTLC